MMPWKCTRNPVIKLRVLSLHLRHSYSSLLLLLWSAQLLIVHLLHVNEGLTRTMHVKRTNESEMQNSMYKMLAYKAQLCDLLSIFTQCVIHWKSAQDLTNTLMWTYSQLKSIFLAECDRFVPAVKIKDAVQLLRHWLTAEAWLHNDINALKSC